MLLPYSNVEVRHWNPGATMPLVLPIHVVCNTDDEVINENIRVNSRRPGKWLQRVEVHEGVALICGSGPSLADTLEEIRLHRYRGGTVFALNGSADYLARNGIMPDYQVILDARRETAALVGPAIKHLFASQCAPETFAAVANPVLWHLQITGIDDLIPAEYEDGFVMVGGAASVGNTATVLAYAMGYRALHCYGYDSSMRIDPDGEPISHAFHQPMNNGDPSAMVPWRGKHYRVSLTMKLQAEKFQETARHLRDAGCAVHVHGTGLLPDIYNAGPTGLSEQEKYEAMWSVPQYRITSPGESVADEFIARMPQFLAGARVIDFGCGTGRGGLRIAETGANVTLVDFAANALDPEATALDFHHRDLTKRMYLRGHYGFCSDVMEHIPPVQVDLVLQNIMACVEECFFAIDFHDDLLGAFIGETLHLSVHPYQWWLDTFMRLGMGMQWSRDDDGRGLFHVTRYAIEAARIEAAE